MKLDVNGIKLNLEHLNEIDPTKDYVLFLHGFTGSAEDWFPVFEQLSDKYNLIALDLIGHGKSDSPSDHSHYTTEAIVNQIKYIKDHLTSEKIFLAGYSMGGRVALSFAIAYPDDIKGLILESSSAGIKNDEE